MRKIVYYVAISIDGYISGPGNDISGFTGTGTGLDKYLADLATFDTVIMGRKTYEFGYNYGLAPGKPAYPHMMHYIFSNNLKFDNADRSVKVCAINLEEIEKIRQLPGTDIYLCGGGQFAGWLLDNHKIDMLRLKLNPLILGDGIRLFGQSTANYQLTLLDTERYEHGLQIMTYKLNYI